MAMGRKLQSYSSDINVTPMVDVMLVLLIIFMVITPMLQHGANINLAKTKNPVPMEDADKEDAVLISVTQDNRIYFDVTQVTEAELTTKVQDRLSSRADKKIYIKADGRSTYGTVVQVVDDVRAAGVDQVGLLTEQVTAANQNKPPAPPPQ